MTDGVVRMHLTEPVRASLVRALNTSLNLVDGSHVADHLPANPWGDVEEFRRAVYLPLHGEELESHGTVGGTEIVLEEREADPIRDVVVGLAESFSGGNPWVALTERERRAVECLLARIDTTE